MNLARVIFLMSVFCIDVRVRADHPAPESGDCWGASAVKCTVAAEGHRRELRSKEEVLVLAPNSIVHRGAAGRVQLVRGQVYFENKGAGESVWITPFATFRCSSECRGMIERESDSVTLKALSGTWSLIRLGEAREYGVAAGMQIRAGEVSRDGRARLEFPQALPWDVTLREWAKLYPGSVEEFKTAAADFRRHWKDAVDSASELHAQVAARALASHEAGLAREQARRRAVAAEEEALRALFRAKNNIDQ